MNDETHVLDLLPAYAIGSLESGEAKQVERHLSLCLICRNDLDSFRAVTEQLSYAVPDAVPSPDLKDRLMTRVHDARPAERESPRVPAPSLWQRLLPAWGVASLFLILALGTSTFVLWQRFDQLEFATSLGMRAVPLSSPDAASSATGFVVISADGDQGALVVDGLPPLGESQQYQLWLIRDGKRTSGAVFSTDEHSYGGTRIRAPRPLLEYTAVDITIEPAGGSPEPTGSYVLGGPLMNP